MRRTLVLGLFAFFLLGTLVAGIVAVAGGPTRAAYASAIFAALSVVLVLYEIFERYRSRPDPALGFRGPRASRLVVVRPLVAPLDHDALVADVLSRLKEGGRQKKFESRFEDDLTLAPITDAQLAAYEEELDAWEPQIRGWLTAVEEYLARSARRIRVPLQIDNGGGEPARGLEVIAVFPDGFTTTRPPEEDEIPDPGPPPKLEPRLSAFGQREAMRDRLAAISRVKMPAVRMPDITPIQSAPHNVTEPRFSEGSLRVEFEVREARHGRTEEGPVLWLEPPGLGRFRVPWTIFADNMPRPRRGRVTVVVRGVAAHLEPIREFQELVERYPELRGGST